MNYGILTAAMGVASSCTVAITALIVNYRGFEAMESRFASLESAVNTRFGSVERRLDTMHTDMKGLNTTMTAVETDVAVLKDRARL